MAKVPKDDHLSSTDSCTRYYFPEIPCSLDNGRGASLPKTVFASGTTDFGSEAESLSASSGDSDESDPLLDEAFRKGQDQGRAEMIAAQQECIDHAAAAFETAINELKRIREQDIERMETETVRLALAIAKKIIGHASRHDQVIDYVVKSAMRQVADSRQMTIRLNPQDVETVKGLQPELLTNNDFKAALRLETDESIQRGGCLIQTRLGDVDARIDQQIQTIEELLKVHLSKRCGEG